MKPTKKYTELVQALNAGKLENNAQLNYLFKTMNNGSPEHVQELKDILNNVYDSQNWIQLSEDQQAKGAHWLRNLYQSPTGRERKNNPYGYREIAILNNLENISLSGYYDAGNRYRDYYIPLYVVAGNNTEMEYYVLGGEIHIVG